MGEFARKSDGRRVFTVEFKRGVVQQLLKGEKTLAAVSRELDIQPSVVRQWEADRRLQPPGAPFGARHAEPGRLPGGGVSEPRTHAPVCLANRGADHLLPSPIADLRQGLKRGYVTRVAVRP